MFKNKLNNYIVNEIIKTYILVLFSFSMLIWIAQAAKFLSLITEAGLSLNSYIFYIILLLPKSISQMIIISFLISLCISILKLIETKEIEIYWLNGISKINIAKTIFKISFFPTGLALLLFLYIVPYSNFKSREILSKSEFTMVNFLVKKNNFNSPLEKLTIFVNKNDNRGNLEKIFIFEELKTIIARKGTVININNKNYLQLFDGSIHQKNKTNTVNVVRFDKTIFDFTKYKTDIIKTQKVQEQSTLWLLKNYKTTNEKNILEEIHKRIFKPLFIPIISFLCCFLLYTNNEKINLTKLKTIIFSISIFFLIFIEILLNLSSSNFLWKYSLYLLPLLGLILVYKTLKNFLERETKN